MKKSQASITAQGIAIARILESEKPAAERICYDPLARRLISPFYYWLGKLFAGYGERRGPGVIGFLVARCRFIDDTLQECLQNGLEQLVILGAGLDSRAYRFELLQSGVRVFEVDHPATQLVKTNKLKQIYGKLSPHVSYVPIDFNQETLHKLFEFGYERQALTLFIWEGVVCYLTAAAVDQTLEFITHNSNLGSWIVFDYLHASALTSSSPRREIRRMQAARRFTGEGLTFGIEAGQVMTFMQERGFSHVQDISSQDLHQRYFYGVNENRAVAPIYGIVTAQVGREEIN